MITTRGGALLTLFWISCRRPCEIASRTIADAAANVPFDMFPKRVVSVTIRSIAVVGEGRGVIAPLGGGGLIDALAPLGTLLVDVAVKVLPPGPGGGKGLPPLLGLTILGALDTEARGGG
jgi:hypothetical protein